LYASTFLLQDPLAHKVKKHKPWLASIVNIFPRYLLIKYITSLHLKKLVTHWFAIRLSAVISNCQVSYSRELVRTTCGGILNEKKKSMLSELFPLVFLGFVSRWEEEPLERFSCCLSQKQENYLILAHFSVFSTCSIAVANRQNIS